MPGSAMEARIANDWPSHIACPPSTCTVIRSPSIT